MEDVITQARRTNLRWMAPAAAAGLVIATPSLWNSMAQAEPVLPPRTADEIIASVLAAEPVAFTGELVQTMNLGLPAWPSEMSVDLTGPNAIWQLASGTNTWRLWYDGADSYRVAIVRGQSESDLISNGQVMWTWSSQTQTAMKAELPQDAGEADNLPVPATSPQEAAKELLREAEEISAVETSANVRVAGRDAYEIIVTPSDASTRVAELRVAVDAETSMPLRLQIFSTIVDEPAVEIGFTKINYAAPNPSVFEFTPPPGAEVIDVGSLGNHELPPASDHGDELPPATPDDLEQIEKPGDLPSDDVHYSGPETIGEGWSMVTVIPGSGSSVNPLGETLPRVSGAWGSGVLLDGTLLSVVFADDGRVALGAVAPDVLYQALAR